MFPRKRFLIPLILITATSFYLYKNPDNIFYIQKLLGIAPCQKPITYKIEQLDANFGLSKEEFKNYLKKAEDIWEKSVGINLFEFSENGKVKVSLIYDYRQKTTDTLKGINETIENSKENYDSLKEKYLSLKTQYETKENTYQNLSESLNKEIAIFDQKIKSWNKKGGAPENVYKELMAEKNVIQNKIDNLNSLSLELSSISKTLSQTVSELNSIAKALNLQVDIYNDVGQTTGKEFNEGIYEQNATGKAIRIYQFENEIKLVRVLAHEFGHALQLDHTTDKNAIMYELNTSNNMKPVKEELTQLKQICKIE